MVLSMELTNAPSSFAHVINNVFKDQLGKSVLVYLESSDWTLNYAHCSIADGRGDLGCFSN